MHVNEEKDLELGIKNVSESGSPVKIDVGLKKGFLKIHTALEKIRQFEDSQDLTCFVLEGFKSKTQVNSPTFVNLLKTPKMRIVNKEELEYNLRSYQVKVFRKFSGFEEKNKKIVEIQDEIMNSAEKNKKIRNLVFGFKKDYHDLKENFLDFIEYNKKFQGSLSEVMLRINGIKEMDKYETQNRSNLDRRKNKSIYSMETINFQEIVIKGFQGIHKSFLEKMKNDEADFSQTIATLKLELTQKNEEIQRISKKLKDLNSKLTHLEDLNKNLSQELDIQYKENSKLTQKHMKILKDLHESKRKTFSIPKSVTLPKESHSKTSELQLENQELKKTLSEYETLLEKLTKTTDFAKLEQENNSLKGDLKILTEKYNKTFKTCEEIKCSLKLLENNTLVESYPNKKAEQDLSEDYPLLHKLKHMPLTSSSLSSFLPKLTKFKNFLESVLMFRLNRHKSFTFPTKIIEIKEIPTKFIEKNLAYLSFLTNFSDLGVKSIKIQENYEKFIKELEFLIFCLKEKEVENRKKMMDEARLQEGIFSEEILKLQSKISKYRRRLREGKKARVESGDIEIGDWRISYEENEEIKADQKNKNKRSVKVDSENCLDNPKTFTLDEESFEIHTQVSNLDLSLLREKTDSLKDTIG